MSSELTPRAVVFKPSRLGILVRHPFGAGHVPRIVHERAQPLAHLVRLDAELSEDRDRHALSLADETKEHVLGVDTSVPELELLT